MPRRGGSVKRNPSHVARQDCLWREIQPRLGSSPLSAAFRKKRALSPDSFVNRVGMNLIPFGNVTDAVFIRVHGKMALFNQAHTTSASLLTGCCFNGHLLHLLFDPAPKAVLHHFLIAQASNLELVVKDSSARLGVRCILVIALLRINLKTTSAKSMAQVSQQTHSINPFQVDGQPLLLTREELTALTGTSQAARQRSWLDARGWMRPRAACPRRSLSS